MNPVFVLFVICAALALWAICAVGFLAGSLLYDLYKKLRKEVEENNEE